MMEREGMRYRGVAKDDDDDISRRLGMGTDHDT